MPSSIFNVPIFRRTFLDGLSVLLTIGFFIYHWIVVIRTAVNVPITDEWVNLPQHPVLPWLFSAHNEHLITTTKVVNLLAWQLNGCDYRIQQIINFALFGFILFALGTALKRSVPDLPVWLISAGLLYCLSPANWENHSWGFQIQWHFTVLFILGCAYFWFYVDDEAQRWPQLALGSLSTVLCVYSLTGGAIAIVAVTGLFVIFKIRRGQLSPLDRSREWKQCLLSVLPVLAALAHFAVAYSRLPGVNAHFFPWTSEFWRYFLTLVFATTGQIRGAPHSLVGGAITLAVILAPWIILGCRRLSGTPVPAGLWTVAAVLVGIAASLVSITIGRASFGAHQAYASRYHEFTMLFVPLSLAAWWCVVESRPKQRLSFAVLYCSAIGYCLMTSMWFFTRYKENHDMRVVGLMQLRVCYYGANDSCSIPYLSSGHIKKEWLRQAKQLNYSFMKQVD